MQNLLLFNILPELKTVEEFLWVTIALCLLLVGIVVAIMAFFMLIQIKKRLSPKNETEQFKPNLWQQFTGLKPLALEKEQILEHNFDGILELNNPTPPWFNFLFYSTILFGFFYLISYHIIGNGKVMENELNEEIEVAKVENEAYMKANASLVNETNVTLLKDAKAITAGKEIYLTKCAACHGAEGQGTVGPNLTDEYWLHGGDIKSVFHTISEGVLDKGMVSWKKTINPIQIQQVASFIESLKGTKPANAKAPQGVK